MANDLYRLASALRRTAFVERRSEPRQWCSDLVQLWWKPQGRWKRKGLGVLEDISPSGACVQLEEPLQKGVSVRIRHPDWKVEGEVRYCIYRDHGYFVGVKLADNFKWSEEVFRPKHLLDPQSVIPRNKKA